MAVMRMPLNQTVIGVETTSTTGIGGPVYAMPAGANLLTYQTIHPDSPSAVNYGIQASMDGSNWITISGNTVLAGALNTIGWNGYKFIRCLSNARTGGSSSKMLVCVAKRDAIR